jgi:hypothetical protein
MINAFRYSQNGLFGAMSKEIRAHTSCISPCHIAQTTDTRSKRTLYHKLCQKRNHISGTARHISVSNSLATTLSGSTAQEDSKKPFWKCLKGMMTKTCLEASVMTENRIETGLRIVIDLGKQCWKRAK